MKIIVLLLSLTALAAARRVRVRPASQESVDEEPQQQLYYQTADEESSEDASSRPAPVLLSRQDNYARALNSRTQQQSLQPKLKASSANKAPPVQTIRNYNKLNDDGSFTFGYEAADGSFKEETRGTDCVVRGKYGYIDPDGNKREFTYVSGNPCDPNAVQSEEEEELPSSGEENIPQNIPRRPNVPLKARPVATTARPRPTTVFQQEYNQDGESEEENIPNIPTRAPFAPTQTALKIPTFAQLEQEIRPQSLRPTPKPHLLVSTPQRQSVSITPRPASPSQPPATTYRPQLVRVTSTAAPPSPSKLPTLDLDSELKNFQLEHNVVSTPRPQSAQPQQPKAPGSPIYTSELVFDPASGQYNTVLYQQLPQGQGDFNLRGRLQPFVHPQQQFQSPFQPQPSFQQPQFPPPQFYQSQPRPFAQRSPPPALPAYQAQPQRALFEQQKSALVQQSQQLYAAQQNKQLQEKPQRFPPSLLRQEPQSPSPSVSPGKHSSPSFSSHPTETEPLYRAAKLTPSSEAIL